MVDKQDLKQGSDATEGVFKSQFCMRACTAKEASIEGGRLASCYGFRKLLKGYMHDTVCKGLHPGPGHSK